MDYIEEKYLRDHPTPVFINDTETILKQMKNNVFQICKKNGDKGTGFFCKIPLDEDQYLPAFITNYHVIDQEYLENEKSISVQINNGKKINKMSISLKYKFTYTNEIYDITIIEIKPNIDNINDFLDFDENILNDPTSYVGNSVYVLHYPSFFAQDKVAVSYGIIKQINENEKNDFDHYCCTTKGSSGSPILNLSNNKIIGVHKLASKDEFNIGLFLNNPLKDFIDKYKRDKYKNLIKMFLDDRDYNLFLKLYDKGFISEAILLEKKYLSSDPRHALKLILRKKEIPKNWVSAWHGTQHEFIESIVEYGLKLPGTKIKDKIIKQNKSYIPLKDNVFGIKNWDNAIFVSKNIHYALSYCNYNYTLKYFLLVEVKIKPGSFTEHKSKFIIDYYCGHGWNYKGGDETDIYRIASDSDVIVTSIVMAPCLTCVLQMKEHKSDENFIDFID